MRECAVVVDWAPVPELERRISHGIDYEHWPECISNVQYDRWGRHGYGCANAHKQKKSDNMQKCIEEEKGSEESISSTAIDEDDFVPAVRGVFAGLQVFSEERERLKSAHVEDDTTTSKDACI